MAERVCLIIPLDFEKDCGVQPVSYDFGTLWDSFFALCLPGLWDIKSWSLFPKWPLFDNQIYFLLEDSQTKENLGKLRVDFLFYKIAQ